MGCWCQPPLPRRHRIAVGPLLEAQRSQVLAAALAERLTSLELLEFINSQRGEGEPELRNDHFMAKVPKVLGEAAPKFLGTAEYTNGTGGRVSRSVYRFPKREAA